MGCTLRSSQRARDEAPLVSGPVNGWRGLGALGSRRDAQAPARGPVRSPLAPSTSGRSELWALAVPPSAEPRLHLRDPCHPRARAASMGSRTGGRGHRGPVGDDRRARARLPSAVRLPAEPVPGVPDLLPAAGPFSIAGPIVVAELQCRQSMPLCDEHLSTASAVGLSVRRFAPADDVLDALVDSYGVEESSFVDATTASSQAT